MAPLIKNFKDLNNLHKRNYHINFFSDSVFIVNDLNKFESNNIQIIDKNTGEIISVKKEFCNKIDFINNYEIFSNDSTNESNLEKGKICKIAKGKGAKQRLISWIDYFSFLFLAMKKNKNQNLLLKSLNIKHKYNKKLSYRYPTFLTLTIPANITDFKFCNRNLLNEALIILQRKFDVKLYIWKAELQKRGSVHYHIICDRYIDIKIFRPLWNLILSKNNLLNGHDIDKLTSTAYIENLKFKNNMKAYLIKDMLKNKFVDNFDLKGRTQSCSKFFNNFSLKNINISLDDLSDIDFKHNLINSYTTKKGNVISSMIKFKYATYNKENHSYNNFFNPPLFFFKLLKAVNLICSDFYGNFLDTSKNIDINYYLNLV